MKVKLICMLVLIGWTLSMNAQRNPKLKSLEDSLSYMVGVSMFGGTESFNFPLDYKILMKGFLAAADSNARFGAEEANSFISQAMEQISKEELERNKKMGSKFLAENKNKEGIIETRTGLQYRVIKEGEGPLAVPRNTVKLHYTAYLLDGSKRDSSYDMDAPVEFQVSHAIPGWREMLQLMRAGGEVVAYVPSYLAYGDKDSGTGIPPGATLIFELKLIEIVK